jgi:hypothetical protein
LAGYDWRSRYATHYPVLYAAALATVGAIAEFGSGNTSTELLHRIAADQHRRLITLDDDSAWLNRFAGLASADHELRLVDDWDAELAKPEWREHWGLVFVDNSPFEARDLVARTLADHADLLVIHDCDFLAITEGLLGRSLAPLNGPRDRGARDYGDMFASWRELFPPEPWPYRPTGPPTLLASNRRNVGEVDVGYDRHLPAWFRVARHIRRILPTSLRMRLANRLGWARR